MLKGKMKKLFSPVIAAALIAGVLSPAMAAETVEAEETTNAKDVLSDEEKIIDSANTLSASASTTGLTSVLMDTTVHIDNINGNNYPGRYNDTVCSYLYENDDGTLTRISYDSDVGVVVEVWRTDGSVEDSFTLDIDLSIWGGFYSGEEYNFIVSGQKNPDCDDEVEVIRIVKYSKDWERIESCSIYGANTAIPFYGGTVSMTEANGYLYIYTCHKMYGGHQANMSFVIDEEAMECTDKLTDISNPTYGYVSHSFDQYIQTDGEYVYRVDLGDGYPRGIYISKTTADDSLDIEAYDTVYDILGEIGNNDTGVEIGGFELSSNGSYLIVGNSEYMDEETYTGSINGPRNIFLIVGSTEELSSNEFIWLTDYVDDDNVILYTPQMVKITNDKYLIMWAEDYSDIRIKTDTGYYTQWADNTNSLVKMVLVDSSGNLLSDIISFETAFATEGVTEPDFEYNCALSDCQPIVTSDGLVTWYVNSEQSSTYLYGEEKTFLYQLNPDCLYEMDSDEVYLIQSTNLANFSVNGIWYYYGAGGEVDTSYTGLATNKNGTFYIKNGQVDFTYSGLYKYNGNWVYIKGGVLKSSYTGLAYNPGTYGTAGWWYLEDGIVKFSYTGIATNTSGTFAVRSGKVDFSYTGLIKSNSAWYYAKSGVIQTSYTGLVYNSGTYGTAGWWYMSSGTVRFITGMATNSAGTWFVQSGIITFRYTGTVIINGNRYTVKNSKVTS